MTDTEIQAIFEEINDIEKSSKIFIRNEKTYSGSYPIKMRGVIFRLKKTPFPAIYQEYENDYLYKGEEKYGFSDDEYPILKETLDYYKKNLQSINPLN